MIINGNKGKDDDEDNKKFRMMSNVNHIFPLLIILEEKLFDERVAQKINQIV